MAPELLAGLPSEVLWTASSDGLVLVAPDGSIMRTNSEFDALFRYNPGALVGEPIETLVPTESVSAHQVHRSRYEEEPGRRAMGEGVAVELLGLRSDGTTFPVDISLSRIELDSAPLTLAAVRDMTEQRRAQAGIAEANRRRAIAEDHDRIARDLHDNVIQNLFAVGLGLESVHSQLDDTQLKQQMSRAVDEIDDVIRTIRQTIYDLNRPPEEINLRAHVVAIAGTMSSLLGFEPEVRFAGPLDEVPYDAIEHVEAVVREALSNVARHAHASAAAISVMVDGDAATVEVVDNGKGIEAGTTRRSGLANLADRAVAMNGSFEFTANAPTGTLVRWSVPIA
ncbi:MAG: histidine kinase [Actinomycetota bacterium]